MRSSNHLIPDSGIRGILSARSFILIRSSGSARVLPWAHHIHRRNPIMGLDVGPSDTLTISSEGSYYILLEMYVPGTQRSFCAVSHLYNECYKAVGSKEQQENQDRMLSGNADEDNYHTFLPFRQRPKSEAR